MFRTAALLSYATLALALSTNDLKVTVTPVSNTVSSIDDIILTAVVSNPTSNDIRVMGVNNVLDSQPSPSFSVTKDGSDVPFTGALVSPDLSMLSNWITIPAGQSVAVNHTVANLYHFESAGTGTYTFSVSGLFHSETEAVPVEANPVTVTVTDDVAFRHLLPMSKRAPALSTPSCGDASKLQLLKDSLTVARSLAGGAASDIKTHPNSVTWNKFFGGNDHDDIWYRFDIIAGDLASSGTRKLYCNSDPAGICSRNTAYTLVVRNGSGQIIGSDIYTCGAFWNLQGTTAICNQPIESINNSKGGVMLHELSHATSGTGDIGYYCNNVQSLSVKDKRNNADNYQCMALNIYRLYRC